MLDRRNEMQARLLATFRVEAAEHLQALRNNLAALDLGPDQQLVADLLEETFRTVHTLKGAARSVQVTEVETICQACESVLSRLTRGSRPPLTSAVLDELHRAVACVASLLDGQAADEPADVVARRLENAFAQRAEPPTSKPSPANARADAPDIEASAAHVRAESDAPAVATKTRLRTSSFDTIRLPAARFDALLLKTEEFMVPKLALAERVNEAQAIAQGAARCRTAFAQSGSRRGEGDFAGEGLAPLLRTLERQARDLWERLAGDHRVLAQTITGVEAEARELRLSPASSVLDFFPGLVRDIACSQNKEVDWIAHGVDLAMDRQVLDALKDPLLHIVRNAIDHGIEKPHERREQGKPERGRIEATVTTLEGGRVEIVIADDGSGIDVNAVRAAAIRSRLFTAEQIEHLSDAEVVQLIYVSGLSTSAMITDVSGHGLGLAIVKDRVERLGGELHVDSSIGRGTAVYLRVPASIATFRGLLVGAADSRFLLPAKAVEGAVRVRALDIHVVEGRETTILGGSSLLVVSLARLLELPERETREDADTRLCVVLGWAGQRVAFSLDEIVGEQEVVVKELARPLVRLPHVAGAGLLGTGELALILRPADLFRAAQRGVHPRVRTPRHEQQERALRVLVVDDSITTRNMEKNLLEVAGYDVAVAVDGRDAWTTLQTSEFDLVVSDVDMPRMDGFELTRSIREDPKLADLPVVLVTALESREDRERGIDVGANAYVVKSSFDQSKLLEIIRRLA